jgi:hypothetical protein
MSSSFFFFFFLFFFRLALYECGHHGDMVA